MLKISGAIFLFIGVVAGVALVISPFGLVDSKSHAAWVLFPGGFAAGFLMLALGGRQSGVGLWRSSAGLLLGLATASALGLVAPVVGILDPIGETLSLWYVLALAGVAGTGCALVPASSAVAP
jgi:hypothetical protein